MKKTGYVDSRANQMISAQIKLLVSCMVLLCFLPSQGQGQHKQLLGTGTNLVASTGLKISFTLNAYAQGSPSQRFVRGDVRESGKRLLTVNTTKLSMTWTDASDTLIVECDGIWKGTTAAVKYIATRHPTDYFKSHIRIEVYPVGGGLWTAEGDPALMWVDVQ
jgi:hypothetical protein